MAKLTRKAQLLFGSSAGPTQIGVFGSLAEGAIDYSTDPADIQSLPPFLEGWYSAILGANAPSIEDMNALFYLYAYQLVYLFQSGIAEWNTSTTYYIGSIAQDGVGNTYVSLQDTNLNNAFTDPAWWKALGNGIRSSATDETVLASDQIVIGTGTVSRVFTLPSAGAVADGKTFKFKNRKTSSATLTIQRAGSDTIDGMTSLILNSTPAMDAITITRTGSGEWSIF